MSQSQLPSANSVVRVPRRPRTGWRRWHAWVVGLACLAIGFGVGSTLRADAVAKDQQADPYARLDTFAQVMAQIDQSYVENVDHDALVYGAIKGMVRSLDPHSSFLTPDELDALRNRTAGQFVGVGLEVGMRDGRITVIAPLPGGPAEAAGVQNGDVITHVDGKPTRDWTLGDAVERLRGKAGTTVKMRVRREGERKPLEFELERAVVDLVSVKQEMLEPGYGLIEVRSFVRNVGHDVRKAYDTLVEENDGEELDGLVLDLRNNPGGLLGEAVDLANVFLERGLIVSTEGRDGFELASHDADSRRAYIHVPLVVLVNGGSASASEIVAGALQDHRRAVIVGTQTFGKGSVQNIYDLEDGSGLKLTIARYYTPSHRGIQGLGISPDIVAQDVQVPEVEPLERVREADLEGALGNGDPSETSDGASDGANDSTSDSGGASSSTPDDDNEEPATPSSEPGANTGSEDAQDGASERSKRLRQLPVRTALDQLKAYKILSGGD